MTTENRDIGFEPYFRAYVRRVGFSFGRMVQIIDEEWKRKTRLAGEPDRGVVVVCPKCNDLVEYESERTAE